MYTSIKLHDQLYDNTGVHFVIVVEKKKKKPGIDGARL